jgi:hypothetical protein
MSTTETTETLTVKAVEEAAPQWKPGPPLKLSGALDSYKSFDVTPNIGREFVEGNLKEWLQAPNSDELIRDLAITSKAALCSRNTTKKVTQSRSAASFSSAPRTTSPTTCKRSSRSALASSPASPPRRGCTSTRSATQAAGSAARTTRSASSARRRRRRSTRTASPTSWPARRSSR